MPIPCSIPLPSQTIHWGLRELLAGRYTAKGPHTCQKRAASCLHEAQDAKQWAEWGVDYVKDDSCRSDRTSPKFRKTLGRLGMGSEDLG